MADPGKTGSGMFSKHAKKRITRAQEKVLQKLGKADETVDQQFEEQVQKFNKQYNEGSQLQKELRGYLDAVKEMHDSSKKMNEALLDMYEPDWYGKEDVKDISQNGDELWGDFHEKLVDNSLLTLDTYLGQFPDIKSRIAKRGRKLVDYDSARHHLESLQNAKKRDDIKVAKPVLLLEKAAPQWCHGKIQAHIIAQTNLLKNQAEEDYMKAQKVFEEINVDLHEELPVILDSRVGFYVSTFKNIAGLEENFHKEIGQLSHEMEEVMIKLGDQHSVKSSDIQSARSEPSPSIVEPHGNDSTSLVSDDAGLRPDHTASPLKSPMQGRKGPPLPPPPRPTPSKEMTQEAIVNLFDDNFMSSAAPTNATLGVPLTKSEDTGSLLDLDFDHFTATDSSAVAMASSMNQTLLDLSWEQPVEKSAPEVHAPEVPAQSPPAASLTGAAQSSDVPPGILYKVQAQHNYTALDSDELGLQLGDMVFVLPPDSGDEQDSGWLLGIKEADWITHKDLDGHKGVFPENFTVRVD
ncbi:myc box-dependent-interacting protein 1-like [Lampetra fluviatilis]